LDIGCGCGLPATRILAKSFNVTGVDFSQVQINRARRFVPAARFLCEDILEVSFQPQSFAAIVTFYAVIHMPLEEHSQLFKNIGVWLAPSGYLLAIVGHEAWTGTDDSYLDVDGGEMCWSHADEATNLNWIRQAGLSIHWKRFIPEGDSGHTLVFAQRPPLAL
jgi:cyclopropane fatty-acyl-phospholipid synthase-like methyltransferase